MIFPPIEDEKYNAKILAKQWLENHRYFSSFALYELLAEFAVTYNAQTKLESDHYKSLVEDSLNTKTPAPVIIRKES